MKEYFILSISPELEPQYLMQFSVITSKAKQQPTCHSYQIEYTMKPIVFECTVPAHKRKTFYCANDMKELFQKQKKQKKNETDNVMSFFKAVNLFRKI